jgi:hypothetical protein
VKTRPPHDAHSFEALVERAKASDVPLAPADVDRMFHALQARLQLAPQGVDGAGASPVGQRPASAPPKLSKAGLGKAALGGMGLLAAAALIYNTQRAQPVPPRTLDAAPTLEGAVDVERAVEAPAGDAHPTGTLPIEPTGATPSTEVGVPVADVAHDAVSPSRAAAHAASPTRRRIATAERKAPVATSESKPEINLAPATSASVEPSSPTVDKPVVTNDGFDASLERLERAERDLRSGNPTAALRTLAVPVATPLRSRADALRAVALCQAGKQAEGRQLALRHLGRNPSSPYEKRLQSACGKDL